MQLSRERTGELYILTEAALWALFPVITILSFASVSPLVSLGWSTLFSGFFFAFLLTLRKKWKEVMDPRVIFDVLAAAILIGVVYYVLFFIGLQHTSAGNASILALSEIFFSYCLFHLFRRHEVPAAHLMGALLMVIGAVIVLYPNMSSFKAGDLFIIAACMVAPFGNFFQQRARLTVSSESVLFVRTLVAVPVIFAVAYGTGADPLAAVWDASLIAILLVNGVFLFGFTKILWMEGIHRISVPKANALASISPLFTLLFAFFLLSDAPTVYQILAFIPMFFGVVLLGQNKQKTPAR